MALTVTLYLSQLITYPYITRILGAEYLGRCNFAQSFVYLFTLLSAMGISTLGTREIAKAKEDRKSLDLCFSRLFYLTALNTIIFIVIYAVLMLTVSSLKDFAMLLGIGIINVAFNLFIVEWFFRGIENFKYITYRTLFIRVIYITLIFIFVKNQKDYVLFFSLTTIITVLNGTINWIYRRRFVSLIHIPLKDIFTFKNEFILLGLNFILLCYYSTTTPILLQLFSDSTQVGYFTTASKLILIILLLYNAYTLVLMPRMSSVISHNDNAESKRLLEKSFEILFIIAIPLLYLIEVFVPEIIIIIAGHGFEGAITPMRISLPVIIIGGLTQITINQTLIPNGNDSSATKSAAGGFILSIILNMILVPVSGAVGASIAWILPELFILGLSMYFCKRHKHDVYIDPIKAFKCFIVYSPLLCLYLLKTINTNIYVLFSIGIAIGIVYIHIITRYYLKQHEYIQLINRITRHEK